MVEIQALVNTSGESLVALFTYAMATAIAVIVLLLLAHAASKIGGEAVIDREAEG